MGFIDKAFKTAKNYALPVAGGLAGFALGGPAGAAAGAGLGLSITGGIQGSKGATPGGQQYSQSSGYGALPPEAQQAYQNYFGMLNQGAQNPGSFAPGQLNQEQLAAYQGLAHPDFSDGSLANYLAPYQPLLDYQSNRINERGARNEADLFKRFGGPSASGGNMNSNIQNLIGQNQRNTGEQLSALDAQGILQALGLRQEALGNQLNFGNAQYGISEGASPYGLTQRYGQALGAIPQSSQGQGSVVGPNAGKQNWMSTVGNSLGAFGSTDFNNYANNNNFRQLADYAQSIFADPQQPYGPYQPGAQNYQR